MARQTEDGKKIADAEYKKAHPDRYFVAFTKLDMPRSSAPEHVWPRFINETFLFEQPDMPALTMLLLQPKKLGALQTGSKC